VPQLGVPWAAPVLLQLLVYAETVPFVTQRLGGDRRRIRLAIAAGSAIPLCMCLLWTAAALGAVPYAPSTAALFDPVASLVGASVGRHSAEANALKAAVLCLAASAISTTVIGSLLAIVQFLEDALSLEKRRLSDRDLRWSLLGVRVLSFLPCALIAALGNEALYYLATEFAGSFPVTALWGLLPPLCMLRLRSKKQQQQGNILIPSELGRRGSDSDRMLESSVWLAKLVATISSIMLAINFIGAMRRIFLTH